jgi:hypothetical protein
MGRYLILLLGVAALGLLAVAVRVQPRRFRVRATVLMSLPVGLFLVLAAAASANVALTQVSSDPFTNSTSQHATEVEPDTFAFGSTVVAAYQVGRFFNGGATDIGYTRSTDGGTTWGSPTFLPGMTFNSGDIASPYERVSDPTVAYDAAHNVWMISSVPILPDLTVPAILVSRSVDGGTTFDPPVQISAPASKKGVSLDKNWTVCDNHATSPFYGHCYTQFDNFAEGDVVYMSTSTDGGATWAAPITPSKKPQGISGQPLVQPDGTVIVPFETVKGSMAAFKSTNGGASWTKATTISRISFHSQAGGLRSEAFPSAEISGDGTVYVAWPDCRFEAKCSADDIVFSTSSDGVAWSAVKRVPLDPAGSGVDHFIPGLAVDPATSGTGTHLALTYYFYPNASCTAATCQLEVGYASSPDGGTTWTQSTQLAGPMSLSDIAATSQGPMVGDYISTSFNGAGTATTVFAIGQPPLGGVFNESMFAPASPLSVGSSAAALNAATSTGVQVLTGFAPPQTAIPPR